jgi:hypothetical protein
LCHADSRKNKVPLRQALQLCLVKVNESNNFEEKFMKI